MAKKRILITGARGFIGNALWRYLQKKQKNFEVFAVTSKTISGSRLFHCDLGSVKNIRELLKKTRPQYILHFAGGRSSNEKEQIRLNCRLTKNLFQAVKAIKNFSPRIVVPGSAAEYGIPKRRGCIRESDELNPLALYGEAKRRQIQIVLQYAQEGLDVVVARIFNILGQGTPATLSVGYFARQIAMVEKDEKKPVIRTESLAGGRDFLDIEDVCSAIICLMRYGKTGEVYNVCSGRKVRMRELLRRLIFISKVKNIRIQEDKTQSLFAFDAVGSNLKIKSLKRWRPKVSLEQSLRNTLETYR